MDKIFQSGIRCYRHSGGGSSIRKALVDVGLERLFTLVYKKSLCPGEALDISNIQRRSLTLEIYRITRSNHHLVNASPVNRLAAGLTQLVMNKFL